MLIPVVAFFAVSFAVVVAALWLVESVERLSGHPVLRRVADWLAADEPEWVSEWERRSGR